MQILIGDLNDPSFKKKVDDTINVEYAGKKVRIRIAESHPRLTIEQREAKAAAKAQKAAERETKAIERAKARGDKQAAKEAARAAKKASKKTTVEPAPAPDIKKAAEKAINAPAKKSHHNPAKGY